MSITGPDALHALDLALRDIRSEEEEIIRKLGRAAERLAEIRETEGELLLAVARGRIEPAQQAMLAKQIAAAESAARETLQARNRELVEGAERLAQLDAELAALAAERAAALTEADRQQAGLRALSPRIATTIARNPDYERQQQEATRLKAVAAAARAKARQADIDREQKGRPYREDPLFAYLLDRQYGDPGYAGRGLVARLDGWVARLTGFATAAAHYRLINELPALLHAHAERQAGVAIDADEAINDTERAAIDAAGGGGLRQALGEAQARMAAVDTRLLAIQDDRDTVTATQSLLVEAEDPRLDDAIDALAQALGGANLAAFITAERVMQRGVDDPMISQLHDARLRVAEEMVDTRDQQARLRTLAGRRHELEDIEYEFKAARYDDPRSLFRDDDLVTRRLDDFLTGALPAKSYWAAFRRGQAWMAGTSDWGGGVGLPRHGRQVAEPSAGREPEPFNRPRSAADADAGA